jgi:hypothetical protein
VAAGTPVAVTVLPRGLPAGDDGGVTTPSAPARPVRRDTRVPGRRARLAPLVAAGALAVGLAACGGSSSSPTTTTKAPAGSSTTSTSGGAASSSTTSSTAAAAATCRTSSLAVSLGPPNGSAGATHYSLAFRNTGTTTCTMYGYPGVSFLDGSGNQIGDPAQRQGGTPAPVALAQGGKAYASVAVTDPGIAPCSGSTAAAQVRVYPPGETQAATIAAPSGLLVCTSSDTAAYQSSTVSPIALTAF